MDESSFNYIRELHAEIEELKAPIRKLVWDRMATFGPVRKGPWPHIFVAMPLSSDLDAVYERYIKPIASELGLTVKRGDEVGQPGQSIIEDIWSAIQSARIVIADCTTGNRNVCYEIGLAHATNRPTILITNCMEDVPFDLRFRRVIVYEKTPTGMQKFRTRLVDAIVSLMPRKKHAVPTGQGAVTP
jgi:hypothetical protein